jgi:hypothetical protein
LTFEVEAPHSASLLTRAGACAIVAWALTAPRSAAAEVPPTSSSVTLDWQAPAECPSREWVLAEVARLLSASHNSRNPTAARVRVEQGEGARWRGELSLDARDAHSERVLEAASCAAVASAAALVVAIAVEGGVPPPPVEAPIPVASAPRTPPSPPRPEQPPRPRSQLVVSLAGVVDGGTLPSVSPGGEASLGWVYTTPGFRVRALGAVAAFPDQTIGAQTSLPLRNEGGVFSLLTMSTRGCVSLVRQPFDLGPCVGAELELLSAEGTGAGAINAGSGAERFKGSHATAQRPSVIGSLFGSWSLSPAFALFVRGDALWSPTQPSFVITNADRGVANIGVYALPTLAARGTLGLEMRFF